MGLVSMTGFGRGEAKGTGTKIDVEISSVNRKQFDVQLNVPRVLAAHEAAIADLVHAVVSRGYVKVTFNLTLASTVSRDTVAVDKELGKALIERLRRVAAECGLEDDLMASTLVALPGVVACSEAELDEKAVWCVARKALEQALEELVGMRAREGTSLEKDIRKRLKQARRVVGFIRTRAPKARERYAVQLRRRIRESCLDVSTDDPDIAKHLALFAERIDISEELLRLESHFAQAEKLVEGGSPVGRPLDFLCQELLREINTIGSKANDATISKHVIRFKTMLESIREQVQNVE